ncbi:hypothetical protein M0Q97_06605 [Candidatus Dojkabacteria bacterium]|jgi:hypothetical protein|nr:hypothetical protein [Candidatus Dojkabacteria bacterium]
MKHLKYFDSYQIVDDTIKTDLLKKASGIIGYNIESENDITDFIEKNIENVTLQTKIDELTDIKKEIKK